MTFGPCDPIKLITPVRSFSLSTILQFSPHCDYLAAQPLEHIADEIDETLELATTLAPNRVSGHFDRRVLNQGSSLLPLVSVVLL